MIETQVIIVTREELLDLRDSFDVTGVMMYANRTPLTGEVGVLEGRPLILAESALLPFSRYRKSLDKRGEM